MVSLALWFQQQNEQYFVRAVYGVASIYYSNSKIYVWGLLLNCWWSFINPFSSLFFHFLPQFYFLVIFFEDSNGSYTYDLPSVYWLTDSLTDWLDSFVRIMLLKTCKRWKNPTPTPPTKLLQGFRFYSSKKKFRTSVLIRSFFLIPGLFLYY